MAFDAKKVAQAANTRPESDEYEAGKVHKLGSRVTTRQASVVHQKLTTAQRAKLTAEYDGQSGIALLRAYADTGERSYLSPEQSEVLSTLVKQCRDSIENESQKRRVWPRKVAAIIVGEIEPPEEPESSDDEPETADEVAAA